MKKKCLIVIQNLSKSGSPVTFLHLINALKDNFDFDVCVTSALNKDIDLVYLEQYQHAVSKVFLLKIETHSKINRLFPYRAYKDVVRLIKKNQYDVTISNAFEVASLINRKRLKTKNVFYSLDRIGLNSKYKIVNYRKSKMLSRIQRCDLFLTLTSTCLIPGMSLSNKNVVELTDYIDIPVLEEKKNYSKSCLNIGTIGYFSEKKNQLFSLKILSKLVSSGIKSKLYLMGYYFKNNSTYFDSLKNFIISNKLEGCVEFLDKDYDKNDFFKIIDVMVAPSLYEGLGLVALESQYMLTPCVLSKNFPKEAQVGLASFADLNNIDEWVNEIKKCKGKLIMPKDIKVISQNNFNKVANKSFNDLFLD